METLKTITILSLLFNLFAILSLDLIHIQIFEGVSKLSGHTVGDEIIKKIYQCLTFLEKCRCFPHPPPLWTIWMVKKVSTLNNYFPNTKVTK